MSPDDPSHRSLSAHGLSRRRLLVDSALGFGALALTSLLQGSSSTAAPTSTVSTGPRSGTHHRAKARNVIFLYMDVHTYSSSTLR